MCNIMLFRYVFVVKILWHNRTENKIYVCMHTTQTHSDINGKRDIAVCGWFLAILLYWFSGTAYTRKIV